MANENKTKLSFPESKMLEGLFKMFILDNSKPWGEYFQLIVM